MPSTKDWEWTAFEIDPDEGVATQDWKKFNPEFTLATLRNPVHGWTKVIDEPDTVIYFNDSWGPFSMRILFLRRVRDA